MLVENIISQNTIVNKTTRSISSLETTIRIITIILNNINKKNDTSSKQIKYRDLKLSNRTFTNVLETNFKLIIDALKINVKVIKFIISKFLTQNKNYLNQRFNQD